jgi:putative glutamine amidotransferase
MSQHARRPVIGLTLDLETPGAPPPRGGPVQPFYALRENYCTAVSRAGGLPLLLPHEPDQAEAYAAGLHGLVVTGGDFDVDPALFGDNARHPSVATKDRRTAFELALARAALARDLPVLGICGGQQLLHVVLGGRLIQHVPDEVPGALEHEQPNPRNEPGHSVAIAPGTLLHRICGCDEIQVNSAHHQAAKEPANGIAGIVVNARAPDGVIEGIEAPAYRFCLGVQWHPEYGVSERDGAIFEAFAAAAADFAGNAP